MIILNDGIIKELCKRLARKIKANSYYRLDYDGIYPILRGGYYIAIELAKELELPLLYKYTPATLIVDDIADSGRTAEKYPSNDIAVLIKKKNCPTKLIKYYASSESNWIQFPWEDTQQDREDLIVRTLEIIGENPLREGLKQTPHRVVKMWSEIYSGYDMRNKPKGQVFKNGSDGVAYDQMITDQGSYYSQCEHHMVPFFGHYWFAYIPHPEGNIIGLSKVARIVDFHSARLQIQERLVQDVVEDIWKMLKTPHPIAMGLVMTGEHLCKTMRGVRKKGSMTTTHLKGKFKTDIATKTEFLNSIK